MKVACGLWVALIGLSACAGVGERTDTSKIIPVEDIYARDTQPTPPPPPLSRMSLLDSVPSNGLCSASRYRPNFDAAGQVTYQTSSPRRVYQMEIGKPNRAYRPMNIEIRGNLESQGLTETEVVFVGFTEPGAIQSGVRRYSASGSTTANDREPLRVGDSALVVAFVARVLELCPLPAR